MNKLQNTIPDLIPGIDYLPSTRKFITREDILSIIDSVIDMNFTEGKYNNLFQKYLAETCDRRYAVSCNSGSSANWLAITALREFDENIVDGDEIITVACGFPTTVNPIIQNKLVPVFVDMNYESLNIECGLIEEAISNKTKAIFVAHTLGNPVNIKRIKEISDKYGLHIIFDCCDSLGTIYDEKPIGKFSLMCTFSFYPAHQITGGEAGAIVTDNPKLYMLLNSLKSWGKNCFCEPGQDDVCGHRFDQQWGDLPLGYDHKYVYSSIGMNLKITDMQAALVYSQLKKLKDFTEIRKNNYKYLFNTMKDMNNIFIQTQVLSESEPCWFGYPIIFRDDKNNISDLIKHLEKTHKIGTRRLFAGNLLRHPAYQKLSKGSYRVYGEMKNTDKIMNNMFWVGVHPSLNNDCMQYISDSIHEFYK